MFSLRYVGTGVITSPLLSHTQSLFFYFPSKRTVIALVQCSRPTGSSAAITA